MTWQQNTADSRSRP